MVQRMLELAAHAITEHAVEPEAGSLGWLLAGGLLWLLALGLRGVSAREKAWRTVLLAPATILAGLLLGGQDFVSGFVYVNGGFLLAAGLIVRQLWRSGRGDARAA